VDTMIIGYALGVISCAIYVALAGRCTPAERTPRPVPRLAWCHDCDGPRETYRGACYRCGSRSIDYERRGVELPAPTDYTHHLAVRQTRQAAGLEVQV
jgi:hypothetical protein